VGKSRAKLLGTELGDEVGGVGNTIVFLEDGTEGNSGNIGLEF
jgi:hypothetical protein